MPALPFKLNQDRRHHTLLRVLTGAPSEWKVRRRVAALVSANPSICRDGHRVLAAGRPD
jgi:hypothetical protein